MTLKGTLASAREGLIEEPRPSRIRSKPGAATRKRGPDLGPGLGLPVVLVWCIARQGPGAPRASTLSSVARGEWSPGVTPGVLTRYSRVLWLLRLR